MHSERAWFAGGMALLIVAVAAPAMSAEPSMPVADQRQENQQKRIGAGVGSEELTPRETIRLEREQALIGRAERRAEADGQVSPRERARLHKMQNKASRDIYRLKHNRR